MYLEVCQETKNLVFLESGEDIHSAGCRWHVRILASSQEKLSSAVFSTSWSSTIQLYQLPLACQSWLMVTVGVTLPFVFKK
jgi:hypothetical protein